MSMIILERLTSYPSKWQSRKREIWFSVLILSVHWIRTAYFWPVHDIIYSKSGHRSSDHSPVCEQKTAFIPPGECLFEDPQFTSVIPALRGTPAVVAPMPISVRTKLLDGQTRIIRTGRASKEPVLVSLALSLAGRRRSHATAIQVSARVLRDAFEPLRGSYPLRATLVINQLSF